MDHLHERATGLFLAYMRLHDPLGPMVDTFRPALKREGAFLIFMRQVMFALAYEEFGTGNQEAFFRLVADYNRRAPSWKYLGPKRFSSPKSLRPYLKKALAHIDGFHKLSGKRLRNYRELAEPYLAPDFQPREF